MTIVSYKN